MGQQQILLIVLTVILVGIAIAVGITMFRAQIKQSAIDAIILDLNNLAADSFQYLIRPVSMGGGGGSFAGHRDYFETLPIVMRDNDNGQYVSLTDYTWGKEEGEEPAAANWVVIAGYNFELGVGKKILVFRDPSKNRIEDLTEGDLSLNNWPLQNNN